MGANKVDFLNISVKSEKVSRNTIDRYFDERNYTKKSTWKQRGFFDHPNCIGKSTWKQRGFFYHRNCIEKSTWKWRGNSLKFGLRRIDVISTSNRCELDMKCLMGYVCSALLGTELEPSRLNSVVPTSCLQIYCKYGYPKMMYT